MSSLKQVEANRRNARKSTGPRTPVGKAVSRMNALKTGIDAEQQVIRGEDPASLADLAAEYYAQYVPATPQERCCVDTLVRAEWQMRRLSRVDAQLWEWMLEGPGHISEAAPLAQGFCRGSNHFVRLERRIGAAERSYRTALRELERLQSGRHASPAPQPVEQPAPVPEIGLVPSASPDSGDLPVPSPPPNERPAAIRVPQIGFVPQLLLRPRNACAFAPKPATAPPAGRR